MPNHFSGEQWAQRCHIWFLVCIHQTLMRLVSQTSPSRPSSKLKQSHGELLISTFHQLNLPEPQDLAHKKVVRRVPSTLLLELPLLSLLLPPSTD